MIVSGRALILGSTFIIQFANLSSFMLLSGLKGGNMPYLIAAISASSLPPQR